MNQSGVLILQPSKIDFQQLYNLLCISAKYVQKILYVDFSMHTQAQEEAVMKTFSPAQMYKVLRGIYKIRTRETASVDIRVLLETESAKAMNRRRCLSQTLDVALLHDSFQNVPGILDAVHSRYNFKNGTSSTLKFLDPGEDSSMMQRNVGECTELINDSVNELQTYGTCAVGGTFDRIHNGHRLLLSTCCLLSNTRIVVGVSDEPLLVNKTLGELIAPLQVRMKDVEEFIDDIKPGLIKEVVPLCDPAGPTRTDPDIQCLVLSSETLKGGKAVNEMRKETGLPEMELFSIDLIGDHEEHCLPTSSETKMSSTLGRQRDLGVLLRPVVRRIKSDSSNVYVIGLTGGIASGKSAIAKRLQKLGAEIINADTLGHSVYEPGTEAYDEILKTFGKGILSSSKAINRRRLGSIVFNDREQLKKLNSIVWPKIKSRIGTEIVEAEKRGCRVCVIEAAVLVEAGWDEAVDEVWVSTIPPSEAVTRMKERNGMTEEEAEKRLSSQITNKERAARANVVLSTLWEPEYTQKQVEKAWGGLMKRIDRNVLSSPL